MINTITLIPHDLAYGAFRDAAAGGGTPPNWTEGDDDPAMWHSPIDAAGGLVLFDVDGNVERCEPPTRDPVATGAQVIADLRESLSLLSLLRGGDKCCDAQELRVWLDAAGARIRATYASCGGRVVALLQSATDWYVAVFRSEIRDGVSERNARAYCEEHGYPPATLIAPPILAHWLASRRDQMAARLREDARLIEHYAQRLREEHSTERRTSRVGGVLPAAPPPPAAAEGAW